MENVDAAVSTELTSWSLIREAASVNAQVPVFFQPPRLLSSPFHFQKRLSSITARKTSSSFLKDCGEEIRLLACDSIVHCAEDQISCGTNKDIINRLPWIIILVIKQRGVYGGGFPSGGYKCSNHYRYDLKNVKGYGKKKFRGSYKENLWTYCRYKWYSYYCVRKKTLILGWIFDLFHY